MYGPYRPEESIKNLSVVSYILPWLAYNAISLNYPLWLTVNAPAFEDAGAEAFAAAA